MVSRNLKFDVVVVGGGSAGVSAAIGAANVGMRTLLIEKNPYFGGAATHSSVFTLCGFFAQQDPIQQVVGGVGNLFLDRLASMGTYSGPLRNPGSGNVIVVVDGESAKVAFDSTVVEAGVTPLLHCQVVNVVEQDGAIEALQCYDHRGQFFVEAKAFVDASGEADVTSLTAGKVRFGDGEGNLQAGTLVMRIGGVPDDVSIDKALFTAAIVEAKRSGRAALTKEKGMVIRLPHSGDILALFADESVNGLEASSLTHAEMSARRQAWDYVNVFREHVPGFEQSYLVSTGPSIGIRETRHAVGEYTLTGEDVLHGVRHPDAIARGGWPVEIHKAGQPAVYQQIKDKGFYDIPLRALKVAAIRNLWCAGRIIDCDPVAFASARVMGTAFATGHAAGVAAAQFAAMSKVDVSDIRRELLFQGALL